jgi:hypothetical protein
MSEDLGPGIGIGSRSCFVAAEVEGDWRRLDVA